MAITGTNDSITWMTSAADSISGWFFLDKLVWTGVGTNGDDIQVMDADSNEQLLLAKGTANGDIILEFSGPHGKASNGIKLTTIDSGQLGIYKR